MCIYLLIDTHMAKFIYPQFIFYSTLSILLLVCGMPASAQSTIDQYLIQQSFSGSSLPIGWATTNSPNNYDWLVTQGINSLEGQSTGSALVLAKNTDKTETNINIWAFTNGILLQKDVIYTLRFHQQNKSGSNNTNASYRLIYSTTQTHTNGINITPSGTWQAGTTWQELSYSFTVPSSGTYYIGFGVTGFVGSNNIHIDEVQVLVPGIRDFYNNLAADFTVPDLNELTSWGANRDGSGPKPSNFSGANHRFNIVNYTSGGKAKLGKDWAVTGLGSRIILGDGNKIVEMTLADKKTITSGPVDVANNATLLIDAPALPTLGTLAPNSTVILGKYAPTDILSNVEFGNLVIDSGKKNKLSKSVKVNGKLDLKAGKLDLAEFDLEMGYDAQVLNGSSANYIIASGNGRLKHGIKPNQEVTLPVGSATTYNPVKIKAASTSQADVFSVRVIDGIYENYVNNTPVPISLLSTNNVNKTWLIDEDVKGGSDITLTLTWTATDALTGFNPLKCYVRHYENGAWDTYVASAAITQGLPATYSVSRPGIKSFSPYSVRSGSGVEPLPVELLHFTANPTRENTVALKWATAQEKNNAYFAVERSQDGMSFDEIARVQGVGTAATRTNYSYTDASPLAGTSYYRLRQVDTDGTFEYLPIRAVTLGKKQALALSLYPNPAHGGNVQLSVKGLAQGEEATLVITGLMGRTILQQALEQDTVLLATNRLKPGTYIVRVITQTALHTQKLVIR